MSISNSYKAYSTEIFSENLENETIIINLATGIYYSLNITGSLIWRAIQEEINLSDLISELSLKTNSNLNISSIVYSFVESLSTEGLVVKSEMEYSSKPYTIDKTIKEFILPAFDKYEDMQGMLLADPIHEVEQDGWPNVKPK